MKPSFYVRWAEFLFKYGKHLIVTVILLTLGMGFLVISTVQSQGVPLDFTPQAIFLDEGELLQELNTIEETFGREDNTFIVLLKGKGLTDHPKAVEQERKRSKFLLKTD